MATQQYKPLPQFTAEQAADFWGKVSKLPGHGPKGECWAWTGHIDKGTGYGVFQVKKARYASHRVAYYLRSGEDPGPLLVLHRAYGSRNGTHTCPDQRRKGETHGMAQLTEVQVVEIRSKSASGVKALALSMEYGVSRGLIYAAVRGDTWKHLPMPE